MARPLAIIQMGDPPAVIRQEAGEQSRWFVQVLALNRGEYRVFRPDRHELLPAIDTICGAIISGSWAMVTDRLAWSEETAQWIRLAHALNLPLLGVGYGHQLIAHALGGLVADNPQGSEHGLQLIQIAENSTAPLLTRCPGRFAAWLSHRQTVLRPPEGASVLAFSTRDVCQILRYSDTAYSVQFHPEFTWDIMAACLKQCGEGLEMAEMSDEPAWPQELLRRFYYLWCKDNAPRLCQS